jgi:hypothetical protein
MGTRAKLGVLAAMSVALACPGNGGSPDAGPTVTFSCSNGTGTMMECDQLQIPSSSFQAAEQGCAQVGGTSGNACTTQGLAGCCTLPTTEEDCYYDPTDAGVAWRQTTCVSAGGTWSTQL